jgi:hypothetical protein
MASHHLTTIAKLFERRISSYPEGGLLILLKKKSPSLAKESK